jgi:hypothetical protein
MPEDSRFRKLAKRILGFLEWQEQEKLRASARRSIIIYANSDAPAQIIAEYLCEGGRTYQLDKQWSARLDRQHVPNTQDHLHIFLKGNQQCVVNRDGTPSHGMEMNLPQHVRSKIAKLGIVQIEESKVQTCISQYLCDVVGTVALTSLMKWSDEVFFAK